MAVEFKDYSAPELQLSDVGSGTIAGYASVFGNADADKDIVVPGAYAASIPKFLKDGFIAWAHDWAKPVATPTVAREDSHGLYVEAEFHSDPESQHARTIAKERMERGKSMGLSIGYLPKAFDRLEGGGRRLKSVDLFEWSIVTTPSNSLAVTSRIKSHKGLYVSEPPEGSYEDVAEDISEAMLSQGLAPAGASVFVVATYPTYAYVCVCTASGEDAPLGEPSYWRVDYQLDDNGDPVLSNPTEVEPGVVFNPTEEPGITFASQSAKALAAVERLATRTSALAALRQRSERKSGRVLSAANHAKLTAVADGIGGHLDAMRSVLKAHAPTPPTDGAKAAEPERLDPRRLWAEFLHLEAKRNGV